MMCGEGWLTLLGWTPGTTTLREDAPMAKKKTVAKKTTVRKKTVAKKKPAAKKAGVNKSQAIRDYL